VSFPQDRFPQKRFPQQRFELLLQYQNPLGWEHRYQFESLENQLELVLLYQFVCLQNLTIPQMALVWQHFGPPPETWCRRRRDFLPFGSVQNFLQRWRRDSMKPRAKMPL